MGSPAEELGNKFQFKHGFDESFRAARSVDATRELNPSLQTFYAWLAQNKDRIPLE